MNFINPGSVCFNKGVDYGFISGNLRESKQCPSAAEKGPRGGHHEDVYLGDFSKTYAKGWVET